MVCKSYNVSERTLSVFNSRYRWQFIATITVHIITCTHGIAVGWLSPSLRLLTSDFSPFDNPITISEASWAGSLIGLGSMTGNVLFGFLLDRIGRKLCMYLVAIPNMIYWILIYTSENITYIYAGRFLAGLTGGGVYVILPIYISELADNTIRGALSSMAMLYVNFGMVIGFILASYLPYQLMPCIVIVLPAIYLMAIIGLPETPQYLLRRGRDAQAENSYRFYKNFDNSITADKHESAQHDEAKKEFELFRDQVLKGGVTEKMTLHDFFNKKSLKILGLICVIIVCNQMSGSFAIFNYSSHIFSQMNNNIDPNLCTIIMGATGCVGIMVAVLIVDRFGRRVLLLSSMAGMGLGEMGIALLKDLASAEFLSRYDWLSLLLMCFVAFIASVGVIPLIFIIIIELLPAKIRSLGTSLSMATFSGFIFVSLKIYPIIIFEYGLNATMYMSAGMAALGCIVLGLLLPETKGKSMAN